MRVFCPNCQEPVTISDDLAGKATFCPLCKAAFTAPTLFNSSAPPPPAPAPTPPAPAPAPMSPPIPMLPLDDPEPITRPLPPAPTPSSSPLPTPSLPPTPPPVPPTGYTRAYGFSIAPEVIQLLAPVCLALAFILTFFSWNGAYPGGHGVYTQGAWRALVGSIDIDRVGEKVLKLNPEKLGENEARLKDKVRANLLMLPYLGLLVAAMVLAIGLVVYPKAQLRLPPQVVSFLPFGMAAVALLALLATGVLALQSSIGFGLENALVAEVKKSVSSDLPASATDEEIKMHEIHEGRAIGQYNIRHTVWLQLVFILQVVATLAALGSFIMTRRTDRPHPRVEVMW